MKKQRFRVYDSSHRHRGERCQAGWGPRPGLSDFKASKGKTSWNRRQFAPLSLGVHPTGIHPGIWLHPYLPFGQSLPSLPPCPVSPRNWYLVQGEVWDRVLIALLYGLPTKCHVDCAGVHEPWNPPTDTDCRRHTCTTVRL